LNLARPRPAGFDRSFTLAGFEENIPCPLGMVHHGDEIPRRRVNRIMAVNIPAVDEQGDHILCLAKAASRCLQVIVEGLELIWLNTVTLQKPCTQKKLAPDIAVIRPVSERGCIQCLHLFIFGW